MRQEDPNLGWFWLRSPNLGLFVIDLGVRKGQVWVFGMGFESERFKFGVFVMGFGSGKFRFGSLRWELGQKSSDLGFL